MAMSVAAHPAATPAAAAALQASTPMLRRFSVEEYHRMIRAGVLTEQDAVELLEGWIVCKMPRNPRHDAVVTLINEFLRAQLPAGWHVRTQSALTMEDSEPEPDHAVIRGSPRDYTARHPSPSEVALVVEVSDSSLPHDREVKGRIYARAGIALYWIINLPDALVEVYSDPSGSTPQPAYQRKEHYSGSQSITLLLPGAEPVQIPPRDLLA